MISPNVQELRTAFSYDYSTGKLYRKMAGGFSEQPISISSNGYARVGFQYKRYGAHRVAWALVTGRWPELDIDHINGIRDDNRLCNLRHVDRSTNLENTRTAKSHNKSSGVLGVSVSPKGLITSRIKISGVDMYLGSFKSVEDASAAYLEAKRSFHKGATV